MAKGVSIQDVAGILGDTAATIERHYAKWTPERQARQDEASTSWFFSLSVLFFRPLSSCRELGFPCTYPIRIARKVRCAQAE